MDKETTKEGTAMTKHKEALEALEGIQAHMATALQTNAMSDRLDKVETFLIGIDAVKLDDAVNTVILSLARPDVGEHDPFLAAKTSFAIQAITALFAKHPNGLVPAAPVDGGG